MAKETVADESLFLWVNSTEMDFLTAIEADHLLPIAFRNRDALDTWVEANELTTDKLGRRDDKADVALIYGLVKPWPLTKNDVGPGLYYRQIWAKVDYRHYRSAIKFAINSSEGSCKSMCLYDGDHAVSQTRLGNLWPDAWVNMILVERGVNRAIGSMMEKEPLQVPPAADHIDINAESILKTFFDRGDETMEHSRLREYLGRARERFIKFKPKSETALEAGTLHRLDNLTMSENAWSFFDHLTDTLGLNPIERPPAVGLLF